MIIKYFIAYRRKQEIQADWEKGRKMENTEERKEEKGNTLIKRGI